MYIATGYLTVNGHDYTPGEVVPEQISKERERFLISARVLRIAPGTGKAEEAVAPAAPEAAEKAPQKAAEAPETAPEAGKAPEEGDAAEAAEKAAEGAKKAAGRRTKRKAVKA